jgi:hypothetical protein
MSNVHLFYHSTKEPIYQALDARKPPEGGYESGGVHTNRRYTAVEGAAALAQATASLFLGAVGIGRLGCPGGGQAGGDREAA